MVRDADGALRDLDWAPEADVEVEPVTIDSPDGLMVLRHSTAHVLAQAVQDLFPGAKLGIGPPIENGFYYDFGVAKPFHPDDLEKLEKRMQEIVKSGQRFRRRRFASLEEAKAELADEPFKLELVDIKGDVDASEVMEVGGGELTIYDNVDAKSGERRWGDLCRGPHLPSTKHIGAFKLMRIAAAYWRGSERNPQLQRIYGTAWPTRDALKAYLAMLEEAARRDHRKLGADLDLFSFPDADRLRAGGVPPEGRHHPAGAGELLAPAARGGRILLRQLAAHHQGAAVRDLRDTSSGTPTACTRR